MKSLRHKRERYCTEALSQSDEQDRVNVMKLTDKRMVSSVTSDKDKSRFHLPTVAVERIFFADDVVFCVSLF